MTSSVPEFIANLFAAIDEQRLARALSWAGAVREINAPFQFVTSRPISASTVTGMRARWAIEGDGVLQMLRWLDRAPESLVAEWNGQDAARCVLPTVEPHRILRFHTKALYEAVNIKRLDLEMSWDAAALASGAESANTLRHLAAGGRTGFPHVLRFTRWLDVPVARFVRGTAR